MKSMTVAGFHMLLLLTCVGCADDARPIEDAVAVSSDAGVDASPQNASDDGEVAPVKASVDLHFLLISALIEMERSLVARCPCLTAAGAYESVTTCMNTVSLGRDWIDCVDRADFSHADNESIRENLRCNIAELNERTECLMGSSCAEAAIAACLTQSRGCPGLPYEVFSEVATNCMIALSR